MESFGQRTPWDSQPQDTPNFNQTDLAAHFSSLSLPRDSFPLPSYPTLSEGRPTPVMNPIPFQQPVDLNRGEPARSSIDMRQGEIQVGFPTKLKQDFFRIGETCQQLQLYYSNLVSKFFIDENGLTFVLNRDNMQARTNAQQAKELLADIESLELVTTYVDLPASMSQPQAQRVVDGFSKDLAGQCFVSLLLFGKPRVELIVLKRHQEQLSSFRTQMTNLL